MSATRTQARMDNLAVGLVAAGSPLRLPFEGKARMAPYGCSAVNWPEMSSTRAGRPRQSRERQIKEAVSLVAPLALYDDARLLELPRGDQATLTSASVSAPMAPSFFLAVSAARRAAHTGQEADGITAGCVHGTSGRRNAGIVPWTSVPWTYSHSVKTSGSRVLRFRRSTRSKASRRSIMHRNISARAGQVCQAV